MRCLLPLSQRPSEMTSPRMHVRGSESAASMGSLCVGGSVAGSAVWTSVASFDEVAPDEPMTPSQPERVSAAASHAGSVGAADGWSVSSRSTRGAGLSTYAPKSFHSANVKEVYLEEWLNIAKTNVPVDTDQLAAPARRLGDTHSTPL